MKMRLIVAAVVTLLVLAIAPVALAARNSHANTTHPAKGKPFLCTGKLVSADATATTITVDVTKGSHVMRHFLGTQTFTLAAKARILVRTRGSNVGFKKTSLADLVTEIGALPTGSSALVHVNGRVVVSTSTFTATLVKVVLPAVTTSPTSGS